MATFQDGKFALSGDSLIENFDLLTIALDSSISGIVITDNRLPDNPIIYCNVAFENISGYRRNEIIGHNCRFLQADDRNQEVRETLAAAIKNGDSTNVEIRNYRKNGDLFWNELYMAPVKDSEGKVTHFIGVQNDITARKKVEHDLRQQKALMEKKIDERTLALRDSEAFLTSIIETVREGLLVLDPKFNVISANYYFLKTFKVTLEETVGKELYALGNNQWDIPQLRELLVKILPTNNPVVDFEVEHDFPHIGRKLMLLNAYRIELEGQFKDQILLAIEDITDRKEIERRKDDFLSIASHELKTPLTTIKGYLQVLERTMPDDASEKFGSTLGKVSKYVERLNNLIAELLDVSRIQTGNIELHHADFDFDRMINEVVDGFQASAHDHKIVLTGHTNAIVNADETHIIQVLNNLLSNAIKYAPQSKQVDLNISNVSEFVKVSVKDYGIGMNAEDKKRIFERFYRGSDIQKRFPGMGIGLYICDQIIKNHNGTLWVESEKGKGSTFSFTLPKKGKNNDEQQ
ncbi:PAS domain-containing protein [Pedobacter sp. MC2016-15]|uniref:sensor histidine kinase n=1 Tax=Pedobacter sp. MC2016-15 TaxID=2994473 RepID=UPI002247AB1D|nr:ATP-binding protein [Pedobacter sp. MC2016-15]MCX2478335.1 PAS domain-containing protein [Pedobacter sp. MC2016-15]